MERIRKLGAAIFDWITDVASVHPSLRTVDVDDFERMSGRRLEELLVPDYIDSVDLRDGWGRLLEVYLGEDRARRLEPHIVLIRSRGANGIFSGPVYAAGAIAPGAVHEDLVWAEGFWIRWPSWLSEVTALPDDRFVVAER